MTEQTDQPDTETIRWQCPYCREYTNEGEDSVRSHINRSADEHHKGKSGWNPENHIPGYDDDGQLVAAIRAGSSQSDDERTISPEQIEDTEWLDEFATEQQDLPDISESLASPANNEAPTGNDMRVSRDAFETIREIFVSHREIGKREQRLAESDSIFAARAQARTESADRTVELLDRLHETASEPREQPDHDPEQ